MYWKLHFGLFLWLLFSFWPPIIAVSLGFWSSFLALSYRANFPGFHNFWAIDSKTYTTISPDISWTSSLPVCPAGPLYSTHWRENLSSFSPPKPAFLCVTYPHALIIILWLEIPPPPPNQLWLPPFPQISFRAFKQDSSLPFHLSFPKYPNPFFPAFSKLYQLFDIKFPIVFTSKTLCTLIPLPQMLFLLPPVSVKILPIL